MTNRKTIAVSEDNPLGTYLRDRRAKLDPAVLGFPVTRRRTPGLRREEVAELAQISVALYTWLEQGRDTPVSRRSIDAIAHALQLTPGEHRHLHHLALQEEVELREDVTPALRHMVLSFRRTPVFVLDHVWDIVLRNTAAAAAFGGPDDLDDRSNMLEEIFSNDHFRSLLPDYDEIAESLLAMFRLEFPTYADEPRAAELVERLRSNNPRFEMLWQRYGVREQPQGARRLDHPLAGELTFEPTLLGVVGSPGLRMMLYTPSNAETEARIERLIESYTASARASESAPFESPIVRLA